MADSTRNTPKPRRRFDLAPVPRAIRAALAMSAATLVLAGSTTAIAADGPAIPPPERQASPQRDDAGAPVLDLTLATGLAPSSVVAGFAFGVAPGLGPAWPLADFVYTNNDAIVEFQAAAPAYGIFGDAGVDDVAVVNNGSIEATSLSDVAVGIFGSGTDVAVDNHGSATGGTIVAHGFNGAFGIEVHAADAGSAINTGSITARQDEEYGSGAAGILVDTDGDASATNLGDIAVRSGGRAEGIRIRSDYGDVLVTNAGDIDALSDHSTLNFGAYGITAFARNGSSVVVNTGAITASSTYNGGNFAIAIGSFTGGDGDAVVDNRGALVAHGYYATGIYADAIVGNARVDHRAAGTISVSGDPLSQTAFGMFARARGGDVVVNSAGDIDAVANRYGIGIYARTTQGDVAVRNLGDIRAAATYGQAIGIAAYARASVDRGDVDVHHGGTIEVSTDGLSNPYYSSIDAIGIAATGDNVAVDVSGDIRASVVYGVARGIIAYGHGTVEVTTGADSLIVVRGDSEIYHGGTAIGISAAGSLTFNGGQTLVDNAANILAVASGGASGIHVNNRGELGRVDNSGTIEATSSDGAANGISVRAYSTGEVANSGSIDVDGFFAAVGIRVLSEVDVALDNVGDISASIHSDLHNSFYASGIAARSYHGDIAATNSADIRSTAFSLARGIVALAQEGAISIENTGSIYAGTPLNSDEFSTLSVGIDARGDDVTVNNAGAIHAIAYDQAVGILVVGDDSATITSSGDVVAASVDGPAVGVYARSNGPIDITIGGDVTATSALAARAVQAFSFGGLTFANSGGIAATAGNVNVAFGADLLAFGPISGTNSGSIAATALGNGEAIGLQIRGIGAIDFLNSGTITATHDRFATAVLVDAGYTHFENTGTIATNTILAGQFAIRGGYGSEVIVNRGDIVGALALSAGIDIFAGYAGGDWLVNNRLTDFGAGDDRVYNFAGSTIRLQDGTIDLGAGGNNVFENSGTIHVSGAGAIHMGHGAALPLFPPAPTAVPSLNALAFVNDGLIDFLDGHPDDVLTITGDFGGDGALAIDIGALAGISDRLYVDGSIVAGTTQTVDVRIDGRASDLGGPVEFATVTGAAGANAFVGGRVLGAVTDFLDVDLDVTSATSGGTTRYLLGVDVAGLNAAGSLAAAVAPGAHSLINSHVGSWRQRMGVTPDKGGERVGLGPWVRVYRDSGALDVDHSESFGSGGDYRFDQTNDGTEVGFNFDTGFGLSYGVMAGSGDATLDLDGIGRDRIDLHSAGLYATWIGTHLYVDATWRTFDFDARLSGAGGATTTRGNATAASIEAGWTGLELAGIAVVPQLQYSRAKIDNVDAVSGAASAFAIDGGVSERLRAGVGFSRTFVHGPVVWTPFGSLNALHEADGENRYTIGGLETGATRTDGTSALVELGLAAQVHGWSLTASANWTDGGALDGVVGGQVVARFTW